MNVKNLFSKSKPKKIQAVTRRATIPMTEDYDSDEPNVRLSRAFLVVLLLHVVAVGGIFAFSSLKKNEPITVVSPLADTPPNPNELPSDSQTYTVRSRDTLGSIASTFGLTRNDLEKANRLADSSSIQAGDRLIIPSKSTAQPVPLNVQKLLQLNPSAKADSDTAPVRTSAPTLQKAVPVLESPTSEGRHYVVQKGDNPASIAKRHGVKYADLLAANKITDPKKLQIGQKLVIPQR